MQSIGKMSLRGTLAMTTAVVAWGLQMQPVHAQSASPRASTAIEEIVVTANKRRENIQKVPIAIATISAASAAKLGITDTQSLVASVPGLNWNRQANSATPFLRGVGTPVGQPGDEPSVAFYVDDVYMPSGAGSLSNFNSVDHLEVDKGPQGTLFGRNATGGVLQVFTKDPTPTPHLDLTLGYANYNTPSASVYATGALTSKITANISAYWSKQYDGWGRDQCSVMYKAFGCSANSPTFLQSDDGGRVKVLFQPSDDTSVLVNVDYDHSKSGEGLGYRAAPGTLDIGGIHPPTGYYDTVEGEQAFFTADSYGASIKMKHNFDWAKLTTITAWRGLDGNSNLDEDNGPFSIVSTHLGTKEKTQSQEVQLSSPDNSALTWSAGLFYYNDYVKAPYYFFGSIVGASPWDIGQGVQATTSYSGYGQATATILPATHLTMGLRYTIDKRKYDASVDQPGVGWTEDPDLPTGKQWTKLTYRFALDHQFTDNIMGYVAYNRGFKSGVYNTTVFPFVGTPPAPPVAPEVLDAYTIGAKTDLLDHHLRINVEGFYYQYKNIQIDNIQGAVTFLSNAAAATIKGIDLDVTSNPIEHLHLGASAEVLNGHYDSFPNGVFFTYNPAGGNTPGSANLAGKDTIQTPPFTLTLTGTYTIPSAYGPFNVNMTYFHGGNYYSDPDNGAGQIAPSSPNNDRQSVLNIINASVGWDSANDRWGARLWAKNLTSQKYWSYVSESSLNTDYSPAPPLTFGVTLQMHL